MEIIKGRFSNRAIIAITLVFIALLSIFVVSNIVTNPAFFAATAESLDNKKVMVLSLAATAAASSTALTFIPGDVATPIANELAQLSFYFVIILSAIVMEKILIGAIGLVAFKYIIPFACALGLSYLFLKFDILRVLAIKLAIFGIVMSVAIPISMEVSDIIYSTYQSSLEQTVETATQNNEYIEEKKQELSDEDKNWIDNIGDYLANITSSIGTGISDIADKAQDTLNNLMDSIAVLLVTTCVMPLVVLLIFGWIIKILFGFDVSKGLKKVAGSGTGNGLPEEGTSQPERSNDVKS